MLQVAADAIKAYVGEHFNQLRTEPEAVFNVAFERAHDAARKAVLNVDSNFKLMESVPIDEYEAKGSHAVPDSPTVHSARNATDRCCALCVCHQVRG